MLTSYVYGFLFFICTVTELTLVLGLASERRYYKVTLSLIGWAQTYHQPLVCWSVQDALRD